MSLMHLLTYFTSRQRSKAGVRKIIRSQPDRDLGRGLEEATQVQAILEQMIQHLSMRYEPDRLACRRASLMRVRHYIHLARLECAARKAGFASAAVPPTRTPARAGFLALLASARQPAAYP